MVKLKKNKLGELIDVRRGASLSGEYYATEGDLIRLTLGNFDYQGGGFKDNTSKSDLYFLGPIKPEFILNEGDIITPLTEQTPGLLGSTAQIPVSEKYIQSQDVALIIPDESKLDKDFCYYLLPSKIVKQQLAAGAQQTKIRHTTPDRIKDLTVFIPELEDQRCIGKLLKSIDRKIALNREINRNLEAMARQLYDYWFVQFDFPDENGRPYKSSGGKMVWNEKLRREIPEGWEVVNLFEAIDVQYGFPFSTELFVSEVTDIPVVRIRDILNGTVSAYSTEKTDKKYRLSKGDVLIGMDGNFHMNLWCDNIAYLNQRSVRFRQFHGSPICALQVMYEVAPYIKAKEQNAKGSTVGHLSDRDLKGLWILNPTTHNLFSPASVLNQISNLIVENRVEISNLTKQRDELLPLLMNGQVSVMPSEVNCDLSLD